MNVKASKRPEPHAAGGAWTLTDFREPRRRARDVGRVRDNCATAKSKTAEHSFVEPDILVQPISVQQIRAARGWLGITQQELAGEACVETATIYRIEKGARTGTKTILKVQEALERRGVSFLFERGCPIGIRLRGRLSSERRSEISAR